MTGSCFEADASPLLAVESGELRPGIASFVTFLALVSVVEQPLVGIASFVTSFDASLPILRPIGFGAVSQPRRPLGAFFHDALRAGHRERLENP